MERRAFLKFLCAGIGAAAVVASSPSKALTRLAPLGVPDDDPAMTPEAAVATPEDMERAKVEKSYWGWRRRRWRRGWRCRYVRWRGRWVRRCYRW